MDDLDLEPILRARSGDSEAFGDLVVKYQPVISAILHRFAMTHADLDDLVQESFVKAWRALPKWEPQQPFIHWLKRIAVRTGLEYCRRRNRSPVTIMENIPDSVDANSDQESQYALEEARQLLATLPADERALLTLVHLNGMSMSEAAEHFGWSKSKTKIKAYRARKLLRKKLKHFGYDE